MERLLALTAILLFGAKPAPAPSPSPHEPLRTIARVHAVTAFCRAFGQHFNGAVAPLLEDDAQIGFVGYTFGEIESHYRALAPELLLYDDRVKLMQYLKNMFASIPQAQGEIDALRATATLTDDPKTAKMAVDLASQLQLVLDRQKAIAVDSLSVVHAMVDVATGTNLTVVPQPVGGPQPAPTSMMPNYGDDPQTEAMPESKRDVRTIVRFDKQRSRIADAESDAAQRADALDSNC